MCLHESILYRFVLYVFISLSDRTTAPLQANLLTRPHDIPMFNSDLHICHIQTQNPENPCTTVPHPFTHALQEKGGKGWRGRRTWERIHLWSVTDQILSGCPFDLTVPPTKLPHKIYCGTVFCLSSASVCKCLPHQYSIFQRTVLWARYHPVWAMWPVWARAGFTKKAK